MSGLHECPYCHWRFETSEDLKQHLKDGCPEMEEA